MTIQEMHAYIDLGTQLLDSGKSLKLLAEAKDLYINNEIIKFVGSNVDAIKKSQASAQFNIVSLTDIKVRYRNISNLIITNSYSATKVGSNSYSLALPTGTLSITSGNLTVGFTYTVLVAGATNLLSFGYKTVPILGESFTCVITDVIGIVQGSGDTEMTVVTGAKYRIKTSTGTAYNTIGATSNNVGTVFICNTTGNITSVVTDALEVIESPPTWDSTTSLTSNPNERDTFDILRSNSNIANSAGFITGALVADTYYKVSVVGTTDLSTYGIKAYTLVDDIFLCTKSGTPSWDGTTKLEETKYIPNRLYETEDINNILNHAFATSRESLIGEIKLISNVKSLVIFSDLDVVNNIELTYCMNPITVSSVTSTDCNLHISTHEHICDMVISKIAGHDASPNYQALKIEENS